MMMEGTWLLGAGIVGAFERVVMPVVAVVVVVVECAAAAVAEAEVESRWAMAEEATTEVVVGDVEGKKEALCGFKSCPDIIIVLAPPCNSCEMVRPEMPLLADRSSSTPPMW